jgi:hypothetical protein
MILKDINRFFDARENYPPDIEGLNFWRVKRLWLERSLAKVKKKFLQ